MAHSSPSFVFLTPLFLLCIVPCAYSNAVPSVKDICAKHRTPGFCELLLKPKDGSAPDCLARHVIDEALANATTAKANIDNLQHQSSDVRLKTHYHTCSKLYDDAQDSFRKARTYLDKKEYDGLNNAASLAWTSFQDCEASETPGFDPSNVLVQNNQDLSNAAILIMILYRFITGKV